MALSGGGGQFGGMGGGMGMLWNQQRSRKYLSEGKPNISRTLALVWKSLRAYRWQLVFGTLVMILGVGMGLIPPLLIRTLINVAILLHTYRLILLFESGLMLFHVGSALLRMAQDCLSS